MRSILTFCVAALLPIFVFAQPGANDPTFNTFDNGIYGDGSGFNGTVFCTVIQSDDKIIVGGTFTTYNGTSRNYIARINTDGSLDLTFDVGTGFDFTVHTIAIQPDGKIIVGGDFQSFNGVTRIRAARLNADGSLDTTFNSGTYLNNSVLSIAIQTDGKIILGGQFGFSTSSTGYSKITRLNTDGSPDLAFHTGAGFNNDVNAIVLQPDGKMIVGGSFTQFNSQSKNRMVRLNPNGSLDASFDPGTGFNFAVYTATLQSDGKILAGGIFTTYNGTSMNRIIRLNPDGSVDASFDPGTGFSGGPTSISIQTDGKLVVGGAFSFFNGIARNGIARLNTNGSLDPGFVTGNLISSTIFTISIQSDGKVIPGGTFGFFDNGVTHNRISRVNTDGSLDYSYNPGSGFNFNVFLSWAYSSSLQSDGKIIVGGSFRSFNGLLRNRIARLNTDGSDDASFNSGTGFDATVMAVVVLPDGKILVGGNFTSYNGTTVTRIARLNSNGTLDPTFTTGSGFFDVVNTIILQPDGKILVGGEFNGFNAVTRNHIARLNANGTLDVSFNPGTAFNNDVFSLALQTDGKVVVGGKFTSFNGTAVNRIARLNANGSLDATFNSGTGFNQDVNSVAIQSDGKIIAGGIFTTYNGLANNYIIRLNTDGSPDITFTPGTGFSASVASIVLQPDEKMIVGGSFQAFNGTARNRIARLDSNGNLDLAFNVGSGFNSLVSSITIQPDGKILVGGVFSSFNGIPRNRLARLLMECPTITTSAITTNVSCAGASNGAINLTPGGGTVPYSFIWNDGSTTEDRTGLTGGTYSVTVNDANGCTTTFNTTLTVPVSGISATTDLTNVSCFGGSDGEIDLTPTGGTFPYTFDWGGGVTSEDRSGLTAGTYSVAITDATGCAVVQVTITQPASAVAATSSASNVNCFGGSNGAINLTPGGGTFPYTFDWGNGITAEDRTGLAAGTYPVTITDANGCSTVISPVVTQPGAIVSSFSAAACYTYTWNSQTYNASGTYTQVFPAVNGCDSTVTLNLAINNATTSSIIQTACNSFTLNGQIYTASGTYVQHLTNTAGCDSTLTLNLTINHPSTSIVTQTVCNSFTLNGQTYTVSGTYIQHLTNATGCDSTLTLNVTINHPTTSSLTEIACNSFTLNNQIYTASGTYTQNFLNAAGCDSILTLHLTINQSPNMTAVDNSDASITASPAATYQWINCPTGNAIPGAVAQTFTATLNGMYAVVGTSNAGCADTSSCITINYLGLDEQSFFDVILAPNPAHDLIGVQFEGLNAILTVRDAQGKLLVRQSVFSGEQISLGNYADGIYIFEFASEKGTAARRVVKN